MKKFLTPLLLFILSCGLFYSCISRQSPNYATVTSSINATENGTNWTATLADTVLNDTLKLHAQTKRYLLQINLPLSASSYAFALGNARYFLFDNSGNITNSFKLDPNYANAATSIINNTINPINKYATGQFKARFIVDPNGINTGTLSADTITFVNGQFTAAYK